MVEGASGSAGYISVDGSGMKIQQSDIITFEVIMTL